MTEGIPLKMASRSESRVLEKDIELEEYVIDMPSDLEPTEWPECCIYRVPKRLRKVNEKAYNPNLVSIGPLHHGKEELKEMEQQKGRYLKEFCCRTKTNPEDLALIINEEKEAKIRHCYAEPSRLIKSKEFVKMILMDGIFIIELFLRNSDLKQRRNDYILRKPWMRNSIRQDLILLENQLPFFVLDDLYKSVDNGFVSFLQLSCNYFSDYYQRKKEPINDEEVKHFTDLLRNFFVPSKLKSEEDGDDLLYSATKLDEAGVRSVDLLYSATKLDEAGVRSVDLLYSATKLDEAGVQFKPDDNLDKTEIQFQKGKCLENYPFLNCSWLLSCLPCLECLECFKSMQPLLKLRALRVDDMTEYVFRNLMALEQCHYPEQAYICNYIRLLDRLINTEKDVDLLIDKKVIVNQLGSSEDVVKLVNKLGLQIVEVNSCYYKLRRELNEIYKNWWNRNMATLRTVYFRDIWRGTATIVGIVVLFMTVWSTFLKALVLD